MPGLQFAGSRRDEHKKKPLSKEMLRGGGAVDRYLKRLNDQCSLFTNYGGNGVIHAFFGFDILGGRAKKLIETIVRWICIHKHVRSWGRWAFFQKAERISFNFFDCWLLFAISRRSFQDIENNACNDKKNNVVMIFGHKHLHKIDDLRDAGSLWFKWSCLAKTCASPTPRLVRTPDA